jgi:NadR type nicotinamide-nucleotide adenylyltransferase
MKKIGLTLGKFAPLHRGHQYMIETAMKEMDKVIVIVYDSPEVTEIPLPVRSNWLRTLYPGIEVIEGWGGPAEIGHTAEIKQRQEQYVLGLLQGKTVSHFYSSEFYGEHTSQALGAIDRRVDELRSTFPISATKVRENPYQHRAMLNPIVYADMITSVVFVGAPSTGKSTLVERLAAEYETVWMPEYGREYWEKHQVNRRLSDKQLVELAEGHLEREEAKKQEADEYLFVDTNAWTTYVFSLDYHGYVHPSLAKLANRVQQRYDLVFLCEDDIPYDDTWDRSGEVHRRLFQRKVTADLLQRKISFIRLRGTVEQRVARVKEVLQRFHKYRGLGELI